MEAVQRECRNLESKYVQFDNEVQAAVTTVMEQAKAIHEMRGDLGEDAAKKLLSKCEANLTSLLGTKGKRKALQDTLGSFANELGAEPPSPNDVKAAFESSLQKRVAAAHKQKHDGTAEMRKLRKFQAGGEAGPSGVDDDDEVVMTQAEIRNFKCPITQARAVEAAHRGKSRGTVSHASHARRACI